jgi:hypothetical protein
MKIQTLNKAAGLLLILLSISVTISLTIKTFVTGGGTWGFGIVGIPILLPLSAYLLFGIAGWINNEALQRNLFIIAHLVTLSIGLISLIIFPVYPKAFVLIPLSLAILSMVRKNRFKYFLLVMILLAIVANILLLKWEIDFDRTLPIFQLFEP